MNLLDHFHPPLSLARHWESFHSRWASAIADALNGGLLPEDFYAEETVHIGSRVEVDVATFEEDDFFSGDEAIGGGISGGTATAAALRTAPQVWTPPAVSMEFSAIFPDSVEILVFTNDGGPTLVAAIELVSPGNKDREESRRAFAVKCAFYLQQGIGLVVIDVVTSRLANLHNELVELLDVSDSFKMPDTPTYAASYRAVRQPNVEKIQVWANLLNVGEALPIMPLPLSRRLVVPLDLNASYTEACERKRIG